MELFIFLLSIGFFKFIGIRRGKRYKGFGVKWGVFNLGFRGVGFNFLGWTVFIFEREFRK